MPASHRRLCSGNLVITLSVALHQKGSNPDERCLWIYPEAEWAKVEAQIDALPAGDPNGVRLRRFFLGSAQEVEPDEAGRLVIPANLRAFARLEKNVMLVGQGRKLELWDEATWNRNFERALEEGFLNENGELSAELQALVL